MESILIKTSQNGGTTWTNLQTPSSFKLTYKDVDGDSYKSCVTGNTIRNRVKPRWITLSISYNLLTDAELDAVARAVNTNQSFYIQCKAPAFGNMGTSNTWVQFVACVDSFTADMEEMQLGWKVSFNIKQIEGGTFQ